MAEHSASGGGAEAPLLSPAGACLAVLLGLVLCWPIFATDALYVFFDTASYISGGETVVAMLADKLGFGPEGAGAGAGAGVGPNADAAPDFVRSLFYSLYAYLAQVVGGPVAIAAGQAAATLFVLFALIGQRVAARPWLLAGGFVYLALLSPLPVYAVYLMPDLMAAVVVLHAALLVRRIDALGRGQLLAVVALAAFAVGAHYGHMPLAVGLFAAALIWRLVRRRLSRVAIVAALVPVLIAPVANLTASSVALDTPSTAPLRLPILLARSIQDGPAKWYLAEACPEADLAFCRAFGDRVPDNIGAFLWNEDGIKSLTQEEMAAIRAEEFEVLARAFRAYPLAQSVSLFGNSAAQVVRIGTDDITPAVRLGADEFEPVETGDLAAAERLLAIYDRLSPWMVWSPAGILGALALTRRLPRDQGEILAMVALGLLLNAAIFGGLSAPVDRYQSRMAWLLCALAFLALVERGELRARRPHAAAADRPMRSVGPF